MSAAIAGGGYGPSPPPFQLLEVTLVSAQDLFLAFRSMHTYAEAWVDPDHRVRTCVDAEHKANPSWNDKFVFRVDAALLRSDTAAVTVEIFGSHRGLLRGAPRLLGTSRLLLSGLRPSSKTNFVAIQIRRPTSLRPQGILNLGIALVDASTRSMPAPAWRDDSSPGAAAMAEAKQEERKKKLKSQPLPPPPPPSEVAPPTPRSVRTRPSMGAALAGGGAAVDREWAALQTKLERWKKEIPATVKEEEKEEDTTEEDEKEKAAVAGGQKSRRRAGKTAGCPGGEGRGGWLQSHVGEKNRDKEVF